MRKLVRSLYLWVAVVLVATIGAVVLAASNDRIHAGLAIAGMKITGNLPQVSWGDLYRMSREHFSLPDLVKTSNPYIGIRSPYHADTDVAAGRELFQSHCARCHGNDGSGGTGPKLQHRQMARGSSDWALFTTISRGIGGTAMPASQLPWLDRWHLVAYLRSLLQTEPLAKLETDTQLQHLPAVTYEDLVAAGHAGDNWLTYSGSYDAHRFSTDSQITAANVSGLRLLWMHQYETPEPSIETSPLVVGRYMFVTLPPNRVAALDAKTGALIWTYNRDLPEHLAVCCVTANRGLAVLGNTLYLGTLDAHLLALEVSTGRVLWDVTIADYRAGYSITGAPLVVKNMVITGVAGGDYGIRGFVQAHDASTGRQIWRFDTIPERGQPGGDTWEDPARRTAGGPTWHTGSFDPDTNLLYWTVGNPNPDFDGEPRRGDNLYTESVVALDADRGTLKWYFQFSPHDLFDWDANEIVVLVDGTVGGERRRLLTQANRNGFYYVLDAESGQFIAAKAFGMQTWAKDIDSHGRPIPEPAARPTPRGTVIYPGVRGATNWESPTYSPMTDLMYVPVLDWGGIFYSNQEQYRPGELYLRGLFQYFDGHTGQAAVRALRPATGEVVWEYRNAATHIGGLLSTAGGVVFGSQEQKFFALDASSGHELWSVVTGGRVEASPITFSCDGKQLVTIAAGHDILTFGL